VKDLYRYTFQPDVSPEDVETALLLAILSTESLHGEIQTRLDAAHAYDSRKGTCVIDASTEAGRDFNKLFVGYLRRDQGENSFRVERMANTPAWQPAEAAA
jgi:hypothetical protein